MVFYFILLLFPYNMTILQSLPIEPWLKFTSTTVGRDKAYRLVQYFTRFLAYYMAHQGSKKETIEKVARLSVALGTARKCKSRHVNMA